MRDGEMTLHEKAENPIQDLSMRKTADDHFLLLSFRVYT